MSDTGNSKGGRSTTLFPNAGSTTAGKIARELREERERAEAVARLKELDPVLNPSSRDGNTITSFGQPIPLVDESPRRPKELQYPDHPNAPDWAKHPSQRKPPPPEPEKEPVHPPVEWLEDQLWHKTDDDVRVYAIMDGYWADGLYGRLLASPDISWAHMFQGDVALNHIQNAPFIIALKRGHKLLKWLIEAGWGNGWGIYFSASTQRALDRYGATRQLPPDMAPSNEERVQLCNLTEGISDPLWLMRRHFRMYGTVEFEDDARVVDFRYYDPATIRTYLPSCNDRELFKFVGPVKYFYAEGYCEVESLNRPQDVYRFSAFPDPTLSTLQQLRSDGGLVMALEGIRYNIKTKKSTAITRLPTFQEKPDREIGIWPMIRTGQISEFQRLERLRFKITLSDWIEKTFLSNKNISKEKLNSFIEDRISDAAKYNLTTGVNVTNYVICTMKYGNDFSRTNGIAKNYLNNLKIEIEHDLTLQEWSDQGNG